MIGLPEILAGAMLASLVIYTLVGGADFGGGVWDLFASGPRAGAQRRLIEDVLAPIWEVNHIWLIVVVVVSFSAFPPAFAAATTALHVPLTILLVGIVLRGSAFSFRRYDEHRDEVQRRWGRLFAVASIVTPVFLGVTLGALTGGEIRVTAEGAVSGGFFAPWLGLFPFACGALTLALCAFLAAVYLTCETADPALADDFRRRALVAGIAVAPAALAAGLAAGPGTEHFQRALLGEPWSWPLQLATGGAALGALAALVRRRFRLARACAVAQVGLIIVGWGLAQRPYLVAPDVTIRGAAAAPATLRLLAIALGVGGLLLLPAVVWLLRVFRRPTP